jgi:GntR family carbon starvation induced transcriptional regulator
MSYESGSSRGPSEALGYTAYELLRDDIWAGKLEPESKLRIERLCKSYKIGPSPMREALSRLAETGLVIAEPQRGYWVAPVSQEEYHDLIARRIDLEGQALTDSIENGSVEWESDVVAAYHRLSRAHSKLSDGTDVSFNSWAREDRAFHLATIANCTSPWLKRFCKMILNQLARYHRQRYLGGIAPGDQTEQEHARFVKAVIERDAARAVTLLKKHVLAVARRMAQDSLPDASRNRELTKKRYSI